MKSLKKSYLKHKKSFKKGKSKKSKRNSLKKKKLVSKRNHRQFGGLRGDNPITKEMIEKLVESHRELTSLLLKFIELEQEGTLSNSNSSLESIIRQPPIANPQFPQFQSQIGDDDDDIDNPEIIEQIGKLTEAFTSRTGQPPPLSINSISQDPQNVIEKMLSFSEEDLNGPFWEIVSKLKTQRDSINDMIDQFVKGTKFAKYADRIKGIVNPQAKTLFKFSDIKGRIENGNINSILDLNTELDKVKSEPSGPFKRLALGVAKRIVRNRFGVEIDIRKQTETIKQYLRNLLETKLEQDGEPVPAVVGREPVPTGETNPSGTGGEPTPASTGGEPTTASTGGEQNLAVPKIVVESSSDSPPTIDNPDGEGD